MSTAAAPVALRNADFSSRVMTGASETATGPERAFAAVVRRRCSDVVNAASDATPSPPETTSVPSTMSPGRSLGSSPPQRPKLRTMRTGRSASASSFDRSADAPPQAEKEKGPANVATSRLRPQTISTASCGTGSPPSSSHPERYAATVRALEVSISGERPERKEFGIAMIAQIEDARKAGRRVERLLPQAVLALRGRKVGDAAGDRRIVGLARPPSARAAPRRFATPCSGSPDSRDSRAGSCRPPRPSRRRRSGFE